MNVKKIRTQFGIKLWRRALLAIIALSTLPQITHFGQSDGVSDIALFTAKAAPAVQNNRSLIKTSNSSTVYWLQNNRIYGIIDGSVVTTMQNAGIPGWNWSSIFTVSSIASYSRGPDFVSTSTTSNGLLVKRYQDSAVYLITNGRKEFLSYEEFVRRGFSFENVIDVVQSILDMFPTLPAPNFTISASPSSHTVTQGQSAAYTITVQNLNGINSGVTLRALNLPGNQVLPGTGFSPQTIVPPPNGSTSSTLTIVTNSQTPTGNFNIVVEGIGNNVVRAITINLTISTQAIPSFTVSATPTNRTVTQGGAASYAVTVQSLNGFSGSVGLFAIGLPSGQPLSGTGFSPQTVVIPANGSATSTLNIITNGQTPTGNFPITLEGRNGGTTKSTTINLTVNGAPANFAVSATPSSRTITLGGSASYTVSVQSQNGFSGSVGLFAINLPSGQPIQGTGFAPATVVLPPNGSATSTLTIATNGQMSTGSFTIRIEGRSNGMIKETTINLNVNRASDAIAPSISAFRASPTSLLAGDPFSISYTVSDSGGSGLNRIELWRTEDRNGQPYSLGWMEVERRSLSGNGPVSGSFTNAPAIVGSYWYGVHVFDNAGNRKDEPAPIRGIVNYTHEPVILVHGWQGGTSAFGEMSRLLNESTVGGKRFKVFSFDYAKHTGLFDTDLRIEVIAGKLKECISKVLGRANACSELQITDTDRAGLRRDKVHIVAHSMGGLVTRTYIAGLADYGNSALIAYNKDIDKFITLATPHYGVQFRNPGSSIQITQMHFASDFLWRLHDSWVKSSYWANSKRSMLAVIGLRDGVVADHAAAGYLAGTGASPRHIYVFKDHSSLVPPGNDGIANVDACHVSFHLVRSFLLGNTIPISGNVSCSGAVSNILRNEQWTFESDRNKGSLLLQVVQPNGETPVAIRSVELRPSTGYLPYPNWNAGRSQVVELPVGTYQVTIKTLPQGMYDDISEPVSIVRGRTTVLKLNARPRTFTLARQFDAGVDATGDLLSVDPGVKVQQSFTASISQFSIAPTEQTISHVSAASYSGSALAAGAIAAAFGSDLAASTEAAATAPLPTTLAGTTVRVRDSAGIERAAPLFFVSPTQVNYLIPPDTAAGPAILTIANGVGRTFRTEARVEAVSPALFTANADGRGWAAAVALRVNADGARHYEPMVEFDAMRKRFVTRQLDLGSAGDSVFLILFGTGLRYRSNLSAVAVDVGGLDAKALYVGPSADFVGLDQINVLLPKRLSGRGELDVTLMVDGKTANPVKISVR